MDNDADLGPKTEQPVHTDKFTGAIALSLQTFVSLALAAKMALGQVTRHWYLSCHSAGIQTHTDSRDVFGGADLDTDDDEQPYDI